MTYGDDTNKVSYSYDNLARTAAKTLTVGGRAYETGYSYLPGSNGSGNTTALISAISQPGEAFSYTYDDVGNISSVTRNGMTTTYVYDKLGQLIRVNDPEDTADGTTWVYEYDLGGNILNKKRYAYTTGDLGSVLETIAYEYDTVWKDKLVKYDGNAITYDAIGNPLTDGTWTYTWEKGRQLKQMTKPGTTATFAYNADGLRIRKTVNGVDTNYTLHGKNIVHMTQGANDLHFWYDAQNRPAIVQFNGEKYGYVVNLQGDIVSLIDNTGTEMVKYVYDAWGKILSTTGALASTLGTIQPFRYRGYVYDQETKLYYLRSRYYNPVQHRFINSDSIILTKLLSCNHFAYCSNSPLINADKNGRQSYVVVNEEQLLPDYINSYTHVLTYRETDILTFTLSYNDAKLMSDQWLLADSKDKIPTAKFNENYSFLFNAGSLNSGSFPSEKKYGVAPGEYTLKVMFYDATDLQYNHHDIFLFIQITPNEDVETDLNTNGWCYMPFTGYGNTNDPFKDIDEFFAFLYKSLLYTVNSHANYKK